MNKEAHITYPGSEKIYLSGNIYPDLRVGMRKITLTPTVSIQNGKQSVRENPPVTVYDTSGAYSDPQITINLKKGLPRMRESWIQERGGIERLPQLSSVYGRKRLEDKSLDSL